MSLLVTLDAFTRIITRDIAPASPLRNAVIALGNFDGFHAGHRHLIDRARAIAGPRPLAVMSVEPHPRQVFGAGEAPFRLCLPRQKHELAQGLGLDFIYQPAFDTEFAGLSPADFVAGILSHRLGVGHVVVGADFRFGARRAGCTATLASLAQAVGIGVSVVELVDGASSTAVRAALKQGDVTLAARILGRPWEAVLEPGADGPRRIARDQICPAPGLYRVSAAGGGADHCIRLCADGAILGAPPRSGRLSFLSRIAGSRFTPPVR